MAITFTKITNENFFETSLDNFVRHQKVTECWGKSDGEYKLFSVDFTEDWDGKKLRSIAKDLLQIIKNGFGYIALDKENVVGFAAVDSTLLGNNNEYLELTDFQVSKNYRGQGIGKQLLHLITKEAKQTGAKKLYISAHPSKESQAAYRALGCVNATWIYEKKAEEEPYDIQMEYVL